VVTGAGIITALGTGWGINAAGFRAGHAAFRPVTLFDVSRQRTKIAAEVDLPGDLPNTQLSAKHRSRLNRASRMLVHAAHEAWKQAGWIPEENLPVVLGTTSGEMTLGEAYLRQAITDSHHFKNQARAWLATRCSGRGLICVMRSVFRVRSPLSPTPALPAPTPSAGPGSWCAMAEPKKF
jgi:3-oxoacyl-(acyl-carrier-protein) synthase